MMKIDGPVYLRLGKNGEPNLLNKDYKFEIGKGIKLIDGHDITLVSTGSILGLSLEIAKKLKK